MNSSYPVGGITSIQSKYPIWELSPQTCNSVMKLMWCFKFKKMIEGSAVDENYCSAHKLCNEMEAPTF